MKKIFLIVLLFSLVLCLSPLPVGAICEGPIVPCGRDLNNNGQIDPNEACQFCHLFVLFNNVINYILTCLAPIIGTLMLIIGGFYFLIAGPKPERINQAKGIVTATVIGLVIIMVSWVFLNTFLTFIGVAKWTGLENWWEIECSAGGGLTPKTCRKEGGACTGVIECKVFIGGTCHFESPLDCAPLPCCCIPSHF